MTYEPHHAYDDHCDYIDAANAAQMEEMGFDAEAAEWFAYEDNNNTEIDNLKSYLFDEDVFQKSEAMRLRDGDGKHSWTALHSVLKHGSDEEIVKYMRDILKFIPVWKQMAGWNLLCAPLPGEVQS